MDSKSPRGHQLEYHHGHHLGHRSGGSGVVSLVPSPRHSLSSSNSSSSSTSSNNNGLHHHHQYHHHHHSQFPPLSPNSSYPPKPVTRSESANPYPTTFVQADTTSFKQVVQMLTGSTETAKQASASAAAPAPAPKPNSEAIKPHPHPHPHPHSHSHSHSHIPPIKKPTGFKLYERRNTMKNLNLNPLLPVFSNNNVVSVSGFSPRQPEILSPSILDFPALVLSPVTPLIPDPFNRSRSNIGTTVVDAEAEDKAIKEKGFFLHPSPASTPRDAEPRLLPLFPTASPGSSSSS